MLYQCVNYLKMGSTSDHYTLLSYKKLQVNDEVCHSRYVNAPAQAQTYDETVACRVTSDRGCYTQQRFLKERYDLMKAAHIHVSKNSGEWFA